VRTIDSCWSIGTIYDPRELPGVSTAGPVIGRGVTDCTKGNQVFCESKGEYTSTYLANVPFGCSGLALCGVKVKQLLLVGQIIITSREPGFSIKPSY
jgi:hypothetical protein